MSYVKYDIIMFLLYFSAVLKYNEFSLKLNCKTSKKGCCISFFPFEKIILHVNI